MLDSAEYKAVVAGGSDRDKFIMSHLATLDRRIYDSSATMAAGAGADGPAPVILAVANSVPPDMEDDMTAWYEQEHIPMLLEVPGWRRIRRYRLIGPAPGRPGPGFLSLHELAGPAVLEDPATGPRSARRGGTGSCPARCAGNAGYSVSATLSAEPLACLDLPRVI